MSETVYEMMMKIGLTGDAMAGLLGIVRTLNHMEHLTDTIGHRIGGWKAGLISFGSILAGSTVLGTMYKILDATKDYNDELIKLQATGGKMADWTKSGEMTNRAFDISRRVPLPISQSLEIPGYTYSLLRGDKGEIMGSWEQLQKYAYVMQFMNKYEGDIGKNIQNVIRAGDITGRITDPATGQIDMARLNHWLDISFRMQTATHNAVNPMQVLNFAKQGGVSLRGLSDEGMYHMGTLIQSLGGYRTGTAYLSEWQQLAAGVMRARIAKGLQDMGFLHQGEWKSDRGGGVILSDEASKRMTALIAQDPMKFAHDIKAKLDSLGIKDPVDQIRMIMRMTGRQTTQRLMGEIVANYAQMMAEGGLMEQGYDVNQAYKLTQDKSISANMNNLGIAWQNLLIALGGPENEILIKFLKSLTGVINSITDRIKQLDPETLNMLWGGGLGAGLGLLGGGVGALVLGALGPVGWLTIALSTLVGIIAKAPAKHDWKTDPLHAFWDKFKETGEELRKSGWLDGFKHKMENAQKIFLDGYSGFINRMLVKTGAWAQEWAKFSITDIVKAKFDSFKTWIMNWAQTDIFAPIKSEFDKLKAWAESLYNSISQFLKTPLLNFFNHKAMFQPGHNKQILQPIQFALNLDGRTLAQAMVDAMEDITTHPVQAPSNNTTASFYPLDGSGWATT